ncbi:MAG: hypothetical protein U0269_13880 [Polyangiales bacterium]
MNTSQRNGGDPPRRLISWALLGASLLPTQACYRTAQLDVVRPALINAAPFGNSYEVRPSEGDVQAGEQIRSGLRARIVASLNRGITLVEANGGLAVQANIRRLEYAEHDARTEARCSHSETVDGQQVQREHPCTNIARTGELQAQVEFRVIVSATQHVLFSRTYESARSTVVRGREGPYPADRVALSVIDPRPLRAQAIDDVVASFAPVILPWMDTVELNFEGCDGDARCTRAYELVQQRNLEGAEQLVTQVAGADGAQIPQGQRVRVGEALYNRAMIRMLRGVYGGAFIDLQRAIELVPDREGFRQRSRQLEQLARDQDSLREQQGVTEINAQSGTSGGEGSPVLGTPQP